MQHIQGNNYFMDQVREEEVSRSATVFRRNTPGMIKWGWVETYFCSSERVLSYLIVNFINL